MEICQPKRQSYTNIHQLKHCASNWMISIICKKVSVPSNTRLRPSCPSILHNSSLSPNKQSQEYVMEFIPQAKVCLIG